MGGGAPDPVYGIGQGLQSGAARGFVEGQVELVGGGQVLGGFNDGPVELGDGGSGCPGRVRVRPMQSRLWLWAVAWSSFWRKESDMLGFPGGGG